MIDLSRSHPAFKSVIETALIDVAGKTPESYFISGVLW
jgi:hypothetical protein